MACLDENEVVALASGCLSGDALLHAQEHLDTCIDCLDLVSLFQQSKAPEESAAEGKSGDGPAENQFVPLSESEEINLNAQAGSTIGRYEIVRAIGRGGMGVVYLARDPELDRMVAIKLVKPSLQGDQRAEHFERRLMREARAMAKLTHPNVLTIYDVGIHQEQVFLASEWIDGCTLEDWISESTHRWQAVLTPFVDAARGLVAAHAAGLVHRDFKPSNVMIGKDNRVLVFDFGLVKSTTVRLDDITTQLSGNFIVGTPAYMSPEQMIGDPADARSDQFSFCASLYESIAGKRPFAGRSLMELLANIKAGKVEEPKNIPMWLWDMLKRGLQRKPEERHSSMSAILAVLETGLAERRRRNLLVGLGVAMSAIIVVAGIFHWSRRVDEDAICGQTISELPGSWDEEKREKVRAGLLSSELPYAQDSWERVSLRFDQYASGWQEQSRSSCLDTKLRGTQSKEVFSRRTRCLTRLTIELDTVTTRLQAGDNDSVYHAVAIAEDLSPLSDCSQQYLQGGDVDSREIQEAQKSWIDLRILHTLLLTNNYQEAAARAQALLDTFSGHRLSEAKLSTVLGIAHKKQGHYPEATEALERAFYAAVAGKDDGIAAEATCEIYKLYALRLGESSTAIRWGQLAKAAVERDGSPLVVSAWHQAQGVVAQEQNSLSVAEDHFQKALQVLSVGQKPIPSKEARVLRLLGTLQLQKGNGQDAELLFSKVLALRSKSLGAHHPEVAVANTNLARALHVQGDTDGAQRLGQEALDSLIASVGDEDLLVAKTLNVMAEFSVAIGDGESANRQLLWALRIKQKVHGKQSHHLLSSLRNLMEVDRMRGRFGDLAIHGEELLRVAKDWQPWRATQEINVRLTIAEAKMEMGEVERAMRECSQLRKGEVSDVVLGRILICLGRASLAQKQFTKARGELQEALGLLASDDTRQALATFALADTLDRLGEKEQAKEHAESARALFAQAGPGWRMSLEKVENWLLVRK